FPPLRFPRVPERLLPIACLALAALVAFVVEEAERRGAPRAKALMHRLGTRAAALPGGALVVALVILLLFLDLHAAPFAATPADGGNRAYKALRAQPGRLLELPVFRPESSVGSIYLYYDTQLRHQRPEGYSTTARPTADRVSTALLPLNCGDWNE